MVHEEDKRKKGTSPAGNVLAAGKRQFLISPRRMAPLDVMGVQPLALSLVEQTLRSSVNVDVVDTISPRSLIGTVPDGMAGPATVIVAKMAPQDAQNLYQQGRGGLIVELDRSLTLSGGTAQQPSTTTFETTLLTSPLPVTVMAFGPDDTPIEGAEVYIFGSFFPVKGITDQRGQVTLSLPGETPQSIRGIYVKPKAGYWSFYQSQPSIDVTQPNIALLKPLTATFPSFPRQPVIAWGQKVMKLDQLPPSYRGQGTKIALLDSGVAAGHRCLPRIASGYDVINKKANTEGWNEDSIGHGTHCAGIIAGNADTGTGIRGVAPDAEIHVCKIFPGGQVSNLVDALEYCIERQIDVVHISAVNGEPSEALEQHLLRARRLGVACIVAAGNSGGSVQYPASSPNVLAVAAIGKLGEFPEDTYHAHTVPDSGAGVIGMGGFFSPKFTSFGPEIGVCGPGVAILSCVPPDHFAVCDGTSLAASYITGLAALILAHHPDFQGPLMARDMRRVDRLFQILKASAQPIALLDPRRTGYGIPDSLVAVGLAPHYATALYQQATMPFPSAQPGFSSHPLGPQSAGASYPFAPQAAVANPFTSAWIQQAQLWPQTWLGTILGQFSALTGGHGGTHGAVSQPWLL